MSEIEKKEKEEEENSEERDSGERNSEERNSEEKIEERRSTALLSSTPAEDTFPPSERSSDLSQVEDEFGRIYKTGKRKTAIARVWLRSGSGHIIVNKKPLREYFGRFVLSIMVNQPFKVAECEGQFDVVCTVRGGGLSGQAGALRHGIASALAASSLEWRKKLKVKGLLTRDARIVERKKYGRRKARRSFQFSKR